MDNVFYLIIAGVFFLLGIGFYIRSHLFARAIKKHEEEMGRKVYELAILKEIQERVGYSLDVKQIVQIISGSLHQFIEYGAVSYMLIDPEKLIFNVHIEKSISRKFIDDIKTRMQGSLSALMDRDFSKIPIEEVLTGVMLAVENEEPVRSFFNIPLVIGEKAVGVLTVSDTKGGLYKEEEMTILYKITQLASKAVTKLQEVVENEELKLNSMVESITEGLIMTDNEYRLVVANPAVKNILGLESKKDLSIFDFIDNLKGQIDIRGKLEESIKLNKNLQLNDIFLKEHFYQVFFSPVKIYSGAKVGEILGGVVIFHDITHEKEVEQLRKDFTSMMVHELRSPLDGIQKIADLLIRKHAILPKKEVYKEYLPIIHKSSSDMLGLVNNLLDIAKIESGKFEVFKSMNDITQIIDERVKFYESSAKAYGLKLEKNISSDIPSAIPIDTKAISSVFNNLISNAMRFSREGGEIAIQAFLHKKDANIIEEAGKNNIKWFVEEVDKRIMDIPDSIIVSVTDSGIGIKKDDISLLFNKFKQLRSTVVEDEKKGSGLGLVISKGIVEAHGGIICVASKENFGTTFYFSLPMV